MVSNADDKKTPAIPEVSPSPPREDLVKTATDFLKAPNVQGTAMHLKRAFLKKKGLSDSEIELAITRAEQLILQQPTLVDRRVGPAPPVGVLNSYDVMGRTQWSRFRDIANTILIFGGLSYSLYYLYQKYGARYLFRGKDEGAKKRKPSLDERLMEVEAGVGECVREMRRLKERRREELEAAIAQTSPKLEEIKSEIASLKKLLLNRKEFAGLPIVVGGGSVSIPSWQREEGSSPSPHDNEETNPSNTNGSDSSLEMIKD